MTAAPRIAIAPATWIGARRSPSSQAASATPTTGSNSIRMPGPRPADRRGSPLRNAIDGMAAAKMPGEQRAAAGPTASASGNARVVGAAADDRRARVAPTTVTSRISAIACSARDRRVAVAADDDEDRLAQGRAEGERRPRADRTRIPAAGSSWDATTATMPTRASPSATIRAPSSRSRPSATFTAATIAG